MTKSMVRIKPLRIFFYIQLYTLFCHIQLYTCVEQELLAGMH